MDPVKVEVGCGPRPRPDYIHCDIRPLPHVEHVCPAWAIPFQPGTVDEIYSRHMIEHLTLAEAVRTLRHWHAVLKIGGYADICLPDLDAHIAQLKQPGLSPFLDREVSNEMHALAGFYGWQGDNSDLHLWGYTFSFLQRLLLESGFDAVEKIEDDSRSALLNIRVLARKTSRHQSDRPDPDAGLYTRRRLWWNTWVEGFARLFTLYPGLPGSRTIPFRPTLPAPLLKFKSAARSLLSLLRQRRNRRTEDRAAAAIGQRLGLGPVESRRVFDQVRNYLTGHGEDGSPDRVVAEVLSRPASMEAREWQELRVYHDGERQAAPSVDGVRDDHRGRYRFAAARVQPGDRVLDIACGAGYGSSLLAEAGAGAVVGVDISDDAIAYAREHYSRPANDFVCGDCLQVDLADDSFDLVVSFETLEHIDQDKVFLQRLHRVLKPEGKLLLSIPNQERMPYEKSRFPYHVRHYTRDQLRALADACGFEIVSEFHQDSIRSEAVTQGWGGLFSIIVARKAP